MRNEPTNKQRAYMERVKRNLEGCEGVSTGVCPGCDDCRSTYGGSAYTPQPIDCETPVLCQYCHVAMAVETDTMPTVSGHCRQCGQAVDADRLHALAHPDYIERWTYGTAYEDDGTSYATEAEAEDAARDAFEDDCSLCQVTAEPSFSHSGCYICGSHLGGDREPWHYVHSQPYTLTGLIGSPIQAKGSRIVHCDGACVDCVIYLANGDLPDLGPDDAEDGDDAE